MNRNLFIRTVSFLVSISLALFGYIIKLENEQKDVNEQLRAYYNITFENLSYSVEEIKTKIEKLQYVSSVSQIASISESLKNDVKSANNELSKLPSSETLNNLDDFLSKVGASSDKLSSIKFEYEADKALITEYVSELSSIADAYDSSEKELDVYAEKNNIDLTDIKKEENDFIFQLDCRINENVMPKALNDKEEITVKEGLLISQKFLGNNKNISFEEETKGKLPVCIYRAQEDFLALTKLGGYPFLIKKQRTVLENNIKVGQATEYADECLSKAGFSGMVRVFESEKENCFIFYYAYLEGATICYNDLVVVTIASDNGEVIELDASKYIYNHYDRTLATPLYSLEQAAEVINDNLQVISSASALLPRGESGEVRCYEFLCYGNDSRKVLLYLNAQTLAEEALVIVE